MGLSNSTALIKEISRMCAQHLTSRVTPDPVRLTAKVIVHGGMRRMMVKMQIPRLLSNQRSQTTHSAFAFHLTFCLVYLFIYRSIYLFARQTILLSEDPPLPCLPVLVFLFVCVCVCLSDYFLLTAE